MRQAARQQVRCFVERKQCGLRQADGCNGDWRRSRVTPVRDSAEQPSPLLRNRHVEKKQQAMLSIHTYVLGSFLTNKPIRSLSLRNAIIGRFAAQRRSAACHIGPSSPAQRVVFTDKAPLMQCFTTVI